MAAKHQHLLHRNGNYYFRVAIPLSLRSALHCAEFKKSIRTGDAALALYVCRALSNRAKLLFIAMSKLVPTDLDLRQIMREYFETQLHNAFAEFHEAMGMRYAVGDHGQEGIDPYGFIAASSLQLAELKSTAARHEFTDEYQATAAELLQRRNFEQHVYSNALAKRLLEADIEVKRIETAYHQRDFGQIPVQHPRLIGCANIFEDPDTFAPAAISPSITLSECMAQYLSYKSGEVRESTVERIRSVLDRLVELFGEQRQMATLTKNPDGIALELMVRRLPKNYARDFKGNTVPLKQLIESGSDYETLEPQTQTSYWIYYKEFFRWAVNRDFLLRSPIDGIDFKYKKSDEDAREPFTIPQLETLFKSAIYTGRKNRKQKLWERGDIKERDGYFWLPLIGLYAGMRMGEILKLRKGDIRAEDGILFFDIHTPDELKNVQSIRQVPVHPELLRLGFQGFVNLREKMMAEGEYYFADVATLAAKQPITKNYSRMFSDYTLKTGMRDEKDGREVFHALRHNFHTALHEAGVPSATVAKLAGHKQAKEQMTTGDMVYVKRRYPMSVLFDAISKMRHSVDLSHLYPS
jgi:integrase